MQKIQLNAKITDPFILYRIFSFIFDKKMSLNNAFSHAICKNMNLSKASDEETKILSELQALEEEFCRKKRPLAEKHAEAVKKRKKAQEEFNKHFSKMNEEVVKYADVVPGPITAKWLKEQPQDNLVAFVYNGDRSIDAFLTVIPECGFENTVPKLTKAYLCFRCETVHRHPNRPMSQNISDIPDDAVVFERYGAKPVWWPPHDKLKWNQCCEKHDSLADQYCSGPGCQCLDCTTSYRKH